MQPQENGQHNQGPHNQGSFSLLPSPLSRRAEDANAKKKHTARFKNSLFPTVIRLLNQTLICKRLIFLNLSVPCCSSRAFLLAAFPRICSTTYCTRFIFSFAQPEVFLYDNDCLDST